MALSPERQPRSLAGTVCLERPAEPKPTVLILTLPHGASHQRAAKALEKALLDIDPGLSAMVVDALGHCAGWFRLYYNSYQIPMKYWPSLWGWIENIQHNSKSTGPGWLYRRGAQPLFRYIEAAEPDVVVATEVGLFELAAMLKRGSRAEFRLVGAPTGMDVDRAWAQPEADLYWVAPGEPALQLEAAGVATTKIFACGMPVDGAFGSLPDRATARAGLQINSDLPLLLVLFGGLGFGKPSRIVAELSKVPRPFQAVFIAGRNQRLKEEIEHLSQGLSSARVLGWVDNIHEWMAAADMALGKPGASTLAEVVNSGLPLIAIDPLPGNERRTCDLIEKWQIGAWVRDHQNLAPTIARLLANHGELERLRANAMAMARPNATRAAARAVLKLLEPKVQARTRSGW